jgi:hypothetical protein
VLSRHNNRTSILAGSLLHENASRECFSVPGCCEMCGECVVNNDTLGVVLNTATNAGWLSSLWVNDRHSSLMVGCEPLPVKRKEYVG